jgi:uncharacterized protein (TIGR03086 family)
MEHGVVPSQPRSPSTHDTLSELIQRGRDREAVLLATDQIADTTRGASMDPIFQLDVIVPLLDGLVVPLDDDQLDAPTPCASFNVRQVLEHMVGGATAFAAAFRGEAARPSELGSDVRAMFSPAMAELVEAIRSPGALERTIKAPFGEVSGETFARFVALDGLVHGWDIATATGQPYGPPPEVIEAIEAFAAQAISDDLRDGDTFALAVVPPPDASPLTRLIAFTGRRAP